MIDSISNAAQDRAQDTLGATITLAQGFPGLPCERSRRPTRPPSAICVIADRSRPVQAGTACTSRPASTLNMESTIRSRPMRRIATLLTLAMLVLAAGSSSAALGAKAPPISLGVAPSKLQTNLIPGQLYKTALDIYNRGGSAVTLDVYL